MSRISPVIFMLPQACSTMDKIVVRYALTIYPYSLCLNMKYWGFYAKSDYQSIALT